MTMMPVLHEVDKNEIDENEVDEGSSAGHRDELRLP